MRSNPAAFQLLTPGSLAAVVHLLADEPGEWTPMAGGTDLMVQYAAGKLPARNLVNICNLPELRGIETTPGEIRIGAGCTYTEIANHPTIRSEFPLLRHAAHWTGGIANQNRGTIGGNIVNASPAADSLPALLVYEAELILVSVRGERRLPYENFHTGYKKTLLAPDELIRDVCLSRPGVQSFSYARKVGARNAQAISKVCMAAMGCMNGGVIEDVRIALGSVAPIPLRLKQTEHSLRGQAIGPELLLETKKSVAAEIRPIDDIRSSARYRSTVAGNLVVEFLTRLSAEPSKAARVCSAVLLEWNRMRADEAADSILPCCGSRAWAQKMAAMRPFEAESALLAAARDIWVNLERSDWLEAFRAHPRIGESRSSSPEPRANPNPATPQSVKWSADEQRDVANAELAVRTALANANREYESRFERVFIVCATGKSASEMLEILRRRLQNDPETEWLEAAEQQRQITEIRLRKWLEG